MASLIGLSFGVPVVTFEAPGDKMAAQRLHLPLPPGMPEEKMGITHVYNTADPIPNGLCVGPYSKPESLTNIECRGDESVYFLRVGGCYAAGFVSFDRWLSCQMKEQSN